MVTLPRSVVEELAEHLRPVGDADGHVFTADKGGVLRPSNFRVKVWLPAVRAAGLAPLRPHDLRHTAVALWIAAGANPKEVSVRAGHTSVAFALDRYGHLFEGHDDELRDRLDVMHVQGLRAVPGGSVVELPGGPSRPVAAPAGPTAKQAMMKTRRGSGPGLG
jgi:integrase